MTTENRKIINSLYLMILAFPPQAIIEPTAPLLQRTINIYYVKHITVLHKSPVLSQVHSFHSCAVQEEDGASEVGSPFIQKVSPFGHKMHPWLHPKLRRAGCVHPERRGEPQETKSSRTGPLALQRLMASRRMRLHAGALAPGAAPDAAPETLWFRRAPPPKKYLLFLIQQPQ